MKKSAKLLSVLLTVAILVTSVVIVLPINAANGDAGFADEAAPTPIATAGLWSDHAATSFKDGVTHGTEGYGTSTKPYEISNAAELAYLAMVVNGMANGGTGASNTTCLNEHFVLTADIDLQGYEWVPIARTYTGSDGYKFDGSDIPLRRQFSFGGVFDGKGYTISNMTFSNNTLQTVNSEKWIPAEYGGIALFGALRGATVENVNVTGTITLNDAKAAWFTNSKGNAQNVSNFGCPITILATAAYSSTFANVHVNANISVTTRTSEMPVAGLVGYATEGTTLTGSSAAGTIKVDNTATKVIPLGGGLVAWIGTHAIIKNCNNYANVTLSGDGTNSVLGGLVGKTNGDSAKVGGAYADATKLAEGMSNLTVIVGCTNYGDVAIEATPNNERIGGLIGNVGRGPAQSDCYIQDCVNVGNVSASQLGTASGCAALVGWHEGRGLQINCCFSYTVPKVGGVDSANLVMAGGAECKTTGSNGRTETRYVNGVVGTKYMNPIGCSFLTGEEVVTKEGFALRMNPKNPAMASIRAQSSINADFNAQMLGADFTVGAFIAPSSVFDAAAVGTSGPAELVANLAEGSYRVWVDEDGADATNLFDGVLQNIGPESYDVEYAAIGYAILTNERTGTVWMFLSAYKAGDDNRNASVSQIAKNYYNDRYRRPLGTDSYQNLVDARHNPTNDTRKAYSSFTNEQLDFLLTYLPAQQ